MKNCTLSEFESKFLNELKNSKYGLSTEDFEHLNYLHTVRSIYDVSDNTDEFTEIEMKVEDGTKFNAKLKCSSQVADPPPAVTAEERAAIYPALLIYYPNKEIDGFYQVFTHELCHLYSLGDYIFSDAYNFKHKCGINKYSYRLNEDDLVTKTAEYEDYCLNEKFNDFVAGFLFDKICGESYYQNNKNIADVSEKLINRLNDFDIDIFEFIGSYFKNCDNCIFEMIKDL